MKLHDTPRNSTFVGRHSELVAQSAFTSLGISVWEPVVPDAHDLMFEIDGKRYTAQVKTITKRNRHGVDYYVIKGRKNDGRPYSREDCDVFVGVYQGEVFLTPNRTISEYWVKVEDADKVWTRVEKVYDEGLK